MTTDIEYDVSVHGHGDVERLAVRRATYKGTGRRRQPATVETLREMTRLETLGLIAQIGAALVELPDDEMAEIVIVTIPGLPSMTRYDAGQIGSQLLRYLV